MNIAPLLSGRRVCRLLALILLAVVAWSGQAHAAFMFTVVQASDDVVVTGSGTIDLTDLTLVYDVTGSPEIDPFYGGLFSGAPTNDVGSYSGESGPSSFGSGNGSSATSATGDFVGISALSGVIDVPLGYSSGTALADTMTFDNATFATLGLTPGTYTYTWGSGADADSLTINVVPEPSTWALLGVGTALLGLTLRRRAARV